MGIRQDVKSGKVTSKEAFSSLELGARRDPPSDFNPEIEAWLRRRIKRDADAQEANAREKAVKEAERLAGGKDVTKKRKKRKKKSWNSTPTKS